MSIRFTNPTVHIAPAGSTFLDAEHYGNGDGVGPTTDLTPFVDSVSVTVAPREDCRVYWGSHGCKHPRGHYPATPHECDCCDCPDHEANEGRRTDWTEDEVDGGEWVCVAKPPYYGPDTNFWGEDA